jgi:Ca2+-binding RTX toxin-like protein
MEGRLGDDTYVVDSFGDTVMELAGEGSDLVYALVNGYTLTSHVENLSLNLGAALSGFGNALGNDIYGNALDNVLDGRGGADELSGLGGNDTFAFKAGEAQGDVVYDFTGNGAGVGDLLKFEGFGTLAQGASLTALGGSQYRVASADGTIQESITVFGSVDIAQDVVFV